MPNPEGSMPPLTERMTSPSAEDQTQNERQPGSKPANSDKSKDVNLNLPHDTLIRETPSPSEVRHEAESAERVEEEGKRYQKKLAEMPRSPQEIQVDAMANALADATKGRGLLEGKAIDPTTRVAIALDVRDRAKDMVASMQSELDEKRARGVTEMQLVSDPAKKALDRAEGLIDTAERLADVGAKIWGVTEMPANMSAQIEAIRQKFEASEQEKHAEFKALEAKRLEVQKEYADLAIGKRAPETAAREGSAADDLFGDDESAESVPPVTPGLAEKLQAVRQVDLAQMPEPSMNENPFDQKEVASELGVAALEVDALSVNLQLIDAKITDPLEKEDRLLSLGSDIERVKSAVNQLRAEGAPTPEADALERKLQQMELSAQQRIRDARKAMKALPSADTVIRAPKPEMQPGEEWAGAKELARAVNEDNTEIMEEDGPNRTAALKRPKKDKAA